MEKIDKAIEILQAFKDGKTIELSYDNGKNWTIFSKGDIFHFGDDVLYRVEKEPTYRPYANAEEFLKASKEHGPYLVHKMSGYYHFPTKLFPDSIIIENIVMKFETFLDKYTFQDGTPCGILEQ